MCAHTGQVEHHRCSRAGRVQKNHKILRKNTISNENPVQLKQMYFEKNRNQYRYDQIEIIKRIKCHAENHHADCFS